MTEEELVYHELLAIFLETSTEGYVSRDVWERVNILIRQLSDDHGRYSGYLLVSENMAHSIPVMTFKQKLRSVLSILGKQTNQMDLNETIVRYRKDSNMNVTNTASSNPVQTNNQSVETKIEIGSLTVVKEIENNLTLDQLNQIEPLLEEYKKKPTRIATERLIGGIINFGKDIATGIVANIISKQIGI